MTAKQLDSSQFKPTDVVDKNTPPRLAQNHLGDQGLSYRLGHCRGREGQLANRKIASLWVIQKSLWATPVYMWKKLGKTVEKGVASSDHILRNVAIATKNTCGESG